MAANNEQATTPAGGEFDAWYMSQWSEGDPADGCNPKVLEHYGPCKDAWDAATKLVKEKFKSTNSASTQCEMCKYENEAADMWPCSDCCHCKDDHFTQRT